MQAPNQVVSSATQTDTHWLRAPAHTAAEEITEGSLTGVEVFGFGQFDGGSSLFLQLDDGLTSLPDDRARRIAGNQNLQEVLAFLCREQETGSQAQRRQLMVSLNQGNLKSWRPSAVSKDGLVAPLPSCFVHLFIQQMHFIHSYRERSVG